MKWKYPTVCTEEGVYMPMYLQRINGSYGDLVGSVYACQGSACIWKDFCKIDGPIKWKHMEVRENILWMCILDDYVSYFLN